MSKPNSKNANAKANGTQKLKGLQALVQDAVDGTSKVVERVQKETAARPFSVLEQIPPLAPPVKGIHAIHDGVVSGVHGAIRWVNRAVGAGIGAALNLADAEKQPTGDPEADSAVPTAPPGDKPPTSP